MGLKLVILLSLCLMLFLGVSVAFNVDIRTAKVYEGPTDSSFGYALALRRTGDSSYELVVGAPKADSYTRAANDLSVTDTGALFSCSTTGNDGVFPRCTEIAVDLEANNIASMANDFNPIEEKSGEWLGATVTVGPRGESLLVCAPRYIYRGPRGRQQEPVGTCFYSSRSGEAFKEMTPCRDEYDVFYDNNPLFTPASNSVYASYHTSGHGMCGSSAALASSSTIAIGSVGSYYWQGKAYFTINSSAADASPRYSSNGFDPDHEDNSLLTYSMDTGEFNGAKGEVEVVAGAPHANFQKGSVRVLVREGSRLEVYRELKGQQTGEHMGYSVTVADVNADGLDDIITGAPMYSLGEPSGTTGSAAKVKGHVTREVGAVYVFLQRRLESFEYAVGIGPPGARDQAELSNRQFVSSQRLGATEGGRLGSALSAVGDLNQDGFEDVAIGEPYGGTESQGAVHIYLGSRKGLGIRASQIIYAADVSPSLQTFGWALSGRLDVDSNGHPDIAVGAYGSDQAVLLRTRPIVSTESTLMLSPSTLSLPSGCGERATKDKYESFDVKACTKVTISSSVGSVRLMMVLSLDHQAPLIKRAFQFGTGEPVITKLNLVSNGDQVCLDVDTYVRHTVSDKYSPIVISLSHILLSERGGHSFTAGVGDANGQAFEKPEPILEQVIATDGGSSRQSSAELPALSPIVTTARVELKKNCGDDDVCTPDLGISAAVISGPHTMGSDSQVEIKISVMNTGEDAYRAWLYVGLPAGSQLNGALDMRDSCVPVVCTQKWAPLFIMNDSASGNETMLPYNGTKVPREITDKVKDVDLVYGEHNGTLAMGRNFIACDLGNPLPSKRENVFKISISMSSDYIGVAGTGPYENNTVAMFPIHARSEFPDGQSGDNFVLAAVHLAVRSTMYILGKAIPGRPTVYGQSLETTQSAKNVDIDQLYENSYRAECEAAPRVSHTFDLISNGPTTLTEAEMTVHWPVATSEDRLFLTRLDADPNIENAEGSCVVDPIHVLSCNSTDDQLKTACQADYTKPIRGDGADMAECKPSTVPPGALVPCPSQSLLLSSTLQRRRASMNGTSASMNGTSGDDVPLPAILCGKIVCTFRNLARSSVATLTVHFRLTYGPGLRGVTANYTDDVIVSSVADVRGVSVVHRSPPGGNWGSLGEASSTTRSYFESERQPRLASRLEWWWVMVGVASGLFLLACLIALLWRFGFFTRHQYYELIHTVDTKTS